MLNNYVQSALLLTLLFLIAHLNSSAQFHYVEATIWEASGDSSSGWIDKSDWSVIPQRVRFKKAVDDTYTQFLTGCDLIKIKFSNGNYLLGYCGTVDSTHAIDIFGKERKQPVLSADALFLMPLVKGKLNLYYSIDKNKIPHFFYCKEGNTPEELHHYQFIYHEEGVSRGIYVTQGSHMVDSKIYKQQMLSAFSDCESVFKTLATANIKFTKKDLRKWFEKYNSCAGASERTSESSNGVNK